MSMALSYVPVRCLPWRFLRLILLLGVIVTIFLWLYLSGDLRFRNATSLRRRVIRHPKLNLPTSKAVQISTKSFLTNQKANGDLPVATDTATAVSLESSHFPRVHAFYYPWYASPSVEGRYLHWNHRILPFWGRKEEAKKAPVYHEPPDDVGAQFYPALGAYSSRDTAVIDKHMEQMILAGIGVAAVSWYPPKLADDNGKPSDDVIPMLLEAGRRHGVSIAFHLEPYEPRTAKDVLHDLHYIIDTYGSHPAFYRMTLSGSSGSRPVVYAYDSYKIPTAEWKSLLTTGGSLSIRNTKYDCFMIGLVLKQNDLQELHAGGFDGSYTYFASKSFTYGSNPQNWKWLSEASQKLGMMFIPSVGPGYDDTALRPWNAENTHGRDAGKYYREMIEAALDLDVEAISITSFNEWGEGTQIEAAVPFQPTNGKRAYLDYQPLPPDGYLALTRTELKNFVPSRL